MTRPTPTAREDPALAATVVSRRALVYAEGRDVALDRPGHVRAGSGVAWLGARLAVVQDDANFLALVDPVRAVATALTLPAGHGGRRQFGPDTGNKAHKLDLEACVALGEVLLGLGSGSTAAREQVLVLRPGAAPALVAAPALYAALRAAPGLAAGQLNLEGAAARGPDVVLFQRGNGRAQGAAPPVDATARVDAAALLAHLADPARAPAPAVRDVRAWDLGHVAGTRLTFTDGAAGPGGRLLYLAAAEASPDTYDDGPVAGTALGVFDDFDGPAPRGRHALLRDAAGAALHLKAEGLTLDPADPRRAWLVVDQDDPARPADLLEVRLEGPWGLEA